MNKPLKEILSYYKLKLIYPRYKLILCDSSQTAWNLSAWNITGNWHTMTVDTNEDKSTGLSGDIALGTVGSAHGGIMAREIILKNYGEISFEHYAQREEDHLCFYIDGVKKLEILGPSPWQRCVPIGLTPGRHRISFEHKLIGEYNKGKGVVDTVTVYEGKSVNCLITEYTPPKPSGNMSKTNILRGFTRFQEMTVADTEIAFTAVFEGQDFIEFMQRSDNPFYFADEFGVCYRGIFPENVSPKNIAMNAIYSVELTMIAGQKTGYGFC